MSKKSEVEPNRVVVELDLPFALHVSSEPLEMPVAEATTIVSFHKVKREVPDPRLRIAEGDFGLVEDRYGAVSYSTAKVEMATQGLPAPPAGFPLGGWPLEIAISAINAFLVHYRRFTGVSWIKQISPASLWSYQVNWFVDDILIHSWSPGHVRGITLPIAGIKKEVEDSVREAATRGDVAPLPEQLILDARDALDHSDEKAAIILGQTAVEVALDDTLVANFWAKRVPLTEVKKALDRDRRRKIISYESAIEKASIRRKLEKGLRLAIGSTPADDATLWHEWETAYALRIAAVHRGQRVSYPRALAAINTYKRLLEEYLSVGFATTILSAAELVDRSLFGIREALNHKPDTRLKGIVQEAIPIIKKYLVFRHIGLHPIHSLRQLDIFAQDDGDALAIWVDPGRGYDDNSYEIAKVLMHWRLRAMDYPFVRVSLDLPPGVSRVGWQIVAETLQKCVLDLPANELLRSAGYDVDALAERSLDATVGELCRANFVPPRSNEVEYRTLSLKLMSLHFRLPSLSCPKLLEVVDRVAPEVARDLRNMVEAIDKSGFSTQSQCVEAMRACHAILVMLDSCLVYDPARRLIYHSSGPRRY